METKRKGIWVSLLAAAVLAACGGGGSETTPVAPVTSVKVVGDSLADSGTFGLKFTVQGSTPTGAGSTAIWPERVASSYGVTLCPRYIFTGSSFNQAAGCTNHAIGGGRINNVAAPTSPVSITQQLANAGAIGYGAGDLLLADGGGNDAADLLGAYLSASKDGAAGYRALLSTLLPAATVDAALASGATGTAQIGGAYMQALADKFRMAIEKDALGKGAMRVAVLNMPGIDKTPRVQQLLAGVAAAAGAAASEQVRGLAQGWVQAFNAQLAKGFQGNAKVVVVDFYTSLNDQVANPAQFGLTNAKDTVCPITGIGSDGLPSYTFATCTATALSALPPPAGATGGADWWKTYAFSDSFHPTPYGHQLLGQLVSRTLAQAGWL
ncbi:MAG TPA: SGNH/GDSL hydrolase family protein [Giesbergeria sp.]|nr:SGNH/GDSL hydrolase family protein [Giesbergeria sp.]HNI75370.1 SGNH/GDSL hydrolase family protein [Giesbergeria sp.]HNK06412.1 SGNH/GDSL hydrolase family protein [Giesbergeria sp.]HNM40177.1 SGNH/GDSL hydrolase family protein [Giesbergeria sp.]HNN17164.1 SGNH/GDSL hydrolase family protein [Giesbergeria sp.]